MGTEEVSGDGQSSGGRSGWSSGRGGDDGKRSDGSGRRDGDGSEDALVLRFGVGSLEGRSGRWRARRADGKVREGGERGFDGGREESRVVGRC